MKVHQYNLIPDCSEETDSTKTPETSDLDSLASPLSNFENEDFIFQEDSFSSKVAAAPQNNKSRNIFEKNDFKQPSQFKSAMAENFAKAHIYNFD